MFTFGLKITIKSKEAGLLKIQLLIQSMVHCLKRSDGSIFSIPSDKTQLSKFISRQKLCEASPHTPIYWTIDLNGQNTAGGGGENHIAIRCSEKKSQGW